MGQWMQVCRVTLHIVAGVLVWIPLSKVKYGVTTQRNSLEAYYGETVHQIRSSVYVHVAGWLMLGSVILWVIAYIQMRWHFARLAATRPVPIHRFLYVVFHFDPINFILDIPDYKVSGTERPEDRVDTGRVHRLTTASCRYQRPNFFDSYAW